MQRPDDCTRVERCTVLVMNGRHADENYWQIVHGLPTEAMCRTADSHAKVKASDEDHIVESRKRTAKVQEEIRARSHKMANEPTTPVC